MSAPGLGLRFGRSGRSLIFGLAGMLAACFSLEGHPSAAHASERSAAQAVEKINDSIALLLDNHLNSSASEDERDEELRVGVERVFQQSFDVEAISQAVLGVAWRRATAEQRKAFQRAFIHYLAQKYAPSFPDFAGAETNVVEAEEIRNDNYIVLVEAKVGGEITNVKWFVLRRGGRSRIVNVVLRNINMLNVERKVIRSLLQQRSGDLDRLSTYLPLRYAGS